MKRFREWLKREWAEWQQAWREIRDERYPRHYEDRFDRFDQAEERSRMLAVRLAVSIEERVRLEAELEHERRVTDVLGTAIFGMTEQERKENACAEAEGFTLLEARRFSQAEIAPYFRAVPKKRMDS